MAHCHLGARDVSTYVYFTLVAVTMAIVRRRNSNVIAGNVAIVLFYLPQVSANGFFDKFRASHSAKTDLYRLTHCSDSLLPADNYHGRGRYFFQYDIDQNH